MRPIPFLLLAAALASPVAAQNLMVMRSLPARVELYSAADGSLVNGSFIDVDGLLGFGGASRLLFDAVAHGGEILVSNYSSQVIHRFSADGTQYLGDLAGVSGRVLGLTVEAGSLWIGGEGFGVLEYDFATQTATSVGIAVSIYDTQAYNGQVLLSRTDGMVDLLDPLTSTVTNFSTPGGGLLEQIALRSAGGVFVVQFSPGSYHELDATGNVVQTVNPGAGLMRGVAELANGNLLVSGTSGVHLYLPTTGASTMLSPGGAAFISADTGGGFAYSSYCTANPNSTGVAATISGSGSNDVAANDVTLIAEDLPPSSFAYFLTSQMQGFTANPGGSSGNLCLSGSIGRFLQLVQNSGPQGRIAAQIDLAAIPHPVQGTVAVAPGETWYFQCWYRDALGGTPTSNFTDGMQVDFR